MRLIILHRTDGGEVAINPEYSTSSVPKEANTAQVNLGPGPNDEHWPVLESFQEIIEKVRRGR